MYVDTGSRGTYIFRALCVYIYKYGFYTYIARNQEGTSVICGVVHNQGCNQMVLDPRLRVRFAKALLNPSG